VILTLDPGEVFSEGLSVLVRHYAVLGLCGACPVLSGV
jgi:hypothetical protein